MKNLLHAIVTAGNDISPVLIVPPNMPDKALAGFPRVEVLRTHLVSPTLRWKARKVAQRIIGFDPTMESFLRRNAIAVLSHSGHLGARAHIPTIGWIPDFQHRRMPKFFQADELRSRDAGFRRLCDFCTIVVVSSRDSQSDLQKFSPSSVTKGRVLQFVSGFRSVERVPSLEQLRTTYGFTGDYFFLPNQFWAHKNHRLVVEALAVLRARGTPVQILCTGQTEDRRQPGYFDELMSFAKAKGVEENLRILGLVPYDDLSALMLHAQAVINPSVFEGWSTTVEEAKSLGKSILLSDIPVHREQLPDRGHYFPPDSPEQLADALTRVAAGWDAAEESRQSVKARDALTGRFAAFAENYRTIVHEALKNPRNDQARLAQR